MNVLRLRRDRRQRNPFAPVPLAAPVAAPACRACSPEDYGPCICPEDCGHLACTGGWREVAPTRTFAAPAAGAPTQPDYSTRMDVDAKLAEIAAQAQAEAERTRTMPSAAAPWGPWDRPGNFPEEMRAVPDKNGRVYGWDITAMDVPPHRDRPYVPEPPLPPRPFSGVSSIWVSEIAYPEPGDLSYDAARNYARTLRHIGMATGTRGLLESEGAWPRPALETGAAA